MRSHPDARDGDTPTSGRVIVLTRFAFEQIESALIADERFTLPATLPAADTLVLYTPDRKRLIFTVLTGLDLVRAECRAGLRP